MENSILQRGTTPVHSFTLPDDLKEVELAALYITYAQSGTVRLEKTMDEVAVDSGVITVQLTQEDTLLFRAKATVRIQIRLRTVAGDALASDVIEVPVGAILKDGVICWRVVFRRCSTTPGTPFRCRLTAQHLCGNMRIIPAAMT